MMSDHPGSDRLFVFLDGELEPAEQAAISRHLDQCQLCTQRLERLQELFLEIGSIPELELERNLAPAVVAQLESGPEQSASLPWWLAAQGLAAVTIMAAWLALQPRPMPALTGLVDQVDLLLWWGRWVMPRLSDLRLALSEAPDRAGELLLGIDMPSITSPSPGVSWVSVIIGLMALWLVVNGVLLGAERAGGYPWNWRRMRKESNHGG